MISSMGDFYRSESSTSQGPRIDDHKYYSNKLLVSQCESGEVAHYLCLVSY